MRAADLLLTFQGPPSEGSLQHVARYVAETWRSLATSRYHVIGAVRDLDKMEAVAEIDEFNPELFTPMEVELNSFESVRKFCNDLNEFKLGRPLDRLLCNAAVYQPSLPYAKWSVDGHEQQMQINFLSHFLMLRRAHLHAAGGPLCPSPAGVSEERAGVGRSGRVPLGRVRAAALPAVRCAATPEPRRWAARASQQAAS